MPTVRSTFTASPDTAKRLCEPRDDLVGEQRADLQPVPQPGKFAFTLDHGPFDRWHRIVHLSGTDTSETGSGDTGRSDTIEVTQTVSFRLALPAWRWLFTPLVRRALRKPPGGPQPWWLTPNRLDAPTARALARLCVLSVVAGYLGTLLTQTNTFAKAEFASSDSALGTMLAAVRVAAVLALAVVALADRRGRKVVLLGSAVAACALAATGALVPDLTWLGVSQTAARTASTAMAIIIGIYAIEEVPAGSRAFTVSVLAMSGALGAGMCVLALPLADLGPGGWRLLYVITVVFIPVVWIQASRLAETRRFVTLAGSQAVAAQARASHVAPKVRDRAAGRRRFALLAGSALLLALFTSPASQLLNEYLRAERGYSALAITVFTLATNTPGVVGIVVGGRLADLRGRRIVGAVAIAGGVGFTVAMFLAGGPWLWVWSVLGAVVGAAAVPALGVYGPELFPTASRGAANGGINIAAVAGAVVGLLAAGLLSETLGGLPTAIALLSVGPVVVVALIIFAYPETAQRELEDLNPGDAVPPRP